MSTAVKIKGHLSSLARKGTENNTSDCSFSMSLKNFYKFAEVMTLKKSGGSPRTGCSPEKCKASKGSA